MDVKITHIAKKETPTTTVPHKAPYKSDRWLRNNQEADHILIADDAIVFHYEDAPEIAFVAERRPNIRPKRYHFSTGRIIAALRDEKWDFRSSSGIARETRLPESHVRAYLRSAPHIKEFNFPNHTGKPVYALRTVGLWKRIRQDLDAWFAKFLGN